ncbi:terminase [Pleionea sp. CnH1-48]|uniref:terminase n=1 Tax=Pleionea sp. CnH1-48 TaxID=2954494 RepID=UPI002097F268|nr:terminase [Pleionea sp. CnH1-48]MCO7225920.1 terminase [Pleionea sp. CnH1-48]
MNLTPADYESQLIETIGEMFFDPYAYVMFAFDWGEGELAEYEGPDVWQEELLKAIRDGLISTDEALRFATSTGHGAGKSALTAWIILWAMSTRPNLSGIVTANTKSQLETKTWRELALWHKRAINQHWFKWTATKFYHADHPETWFVAAVPNSEQNSEAFAGLHARYVLVIYDEASAIPDKIWEVTEGAMTTSWALWITFGNPTRNTGRFRECYGRFGHRWNGRKVDTRTCAMADQRQISQWLSDYGEDSDFFRVRVRGEFPRAGSNQFIATDLVEAAMLRCVPKEVYFNFPKKIGVDVARFGDDRSVIIRRQCAKVWEPLTFRGIDTMELCAYVVDEFNRWGGDAIIYVDGVGVGGPVVDRLRQLGLPVVDVQAASSSTERTRYANMRAELWGRLRDWFQDEPELPNLPELKEDLIGIEYGFNNRMQIQLERKADMKKRGLDSPDIGDALADSFAPDMLISGRVVAQPIRRTARRGWT